MTSALTHFDVLVIGGGMGLPIATNCARAGLSTALIERDMFGGADTLRGDAVRTTLIDTIERSEKAHRRAIGDGHLPPQAAHHALNHAFGKGLSAARRLEAGINRTIHVVLGRAAFVDENRVVVNGTELSAEKIVVAVGSSAVRPDGVWTNLPIVTPDDLGTFDEAPKTITILGGGPTACFWTHVFERLGSDVVQIHRGARLLERHDEDLSESFTRSFRRSHRVMTDATIGAASHDGRRFKILVQKGGETVSRYSEKVVVAYGRRPSTDGLFLDRAAVALGQGGEIIVDEFSRTNVPGIFAFGDVTNERGACAVGSTDAERLVRSLIDPKATEKRRPEPSVFTLPVRPEIASVGTAITGGAEGASATLSAVLPWPDADDSATDAPIFKLLADRNGRILGAHAVGRGASDAVSLIALAMRTGETLADLANLAAPEKSRAEVLVAAAREVLRQIG